MNVFYMLVVEIYLDFVANEQADRPRERPLKSEVAKTLPISNDDSKHSRKGEFVAPSSGRLAIKDTARHVGNTNSALSINTTPYTFCTSNGINAHLIGFDWKERERKTSPETCTVSEQKGNIVSVLFRQHKCLKCILETSNISFRCSKMFTHFLYY